MFPREFNSGLYWSKINHILNEDEIKFYWLFSETMYCIRKQNTDLITIYKHLKPFWYSAYLKKYKEEQFLMVGSVCKFTINSMWYA